MFKRTAVSLVAGVIVAGATVIASPTGPATAAGFGFTVVSPVPGSVGVDDPSNSNGYDITPCQLGWSGNGGSVGGNVAGSPAKLRFELYPGGGACGGAYDGWGNVGGVHFEAGPGQYQNMGTVVLPVVGNPGVFRMEGGILSSTPVPNGRVKVDTFQVADFQQSTVQYGGFASTSSRGTRWSGGATWAGQYLLFIHDTATGRKITAYTHVSAGTIPTIDLDAICFGFDTCNYTAGGPGVTAGTFHPTAPTRILDTRRGLGITNGPVRGGDGRHWSPNPVTRADETANHDLQVTGRYGIPASGVSAVLLNVTAVDAPGVGFLSVVPKPARVGDVFNDQGSYFQSPGVYGPTPGTSNLNVGSSGPVPNLVLARVGAGGKIRIFNSYGPTHVIADVAGWIGTGGAHTNGSGFQGVAPKRVLDTRNGIGGPKARVGAGQSRVIPVRGVAGVPTNAQSVVVNITSVGASGSGFATAYPDGTSVPDASNLNYGPNGVRANTAVVKIGANGAIRLRAAESDTDLIVDIVGSFGPGGGRVTAISPQRLVDSRHGTGTPQRKFGPYESRSVQIAGRGGVPANATAIVANVTATNPSELGYLTAWPSGSARPSTSSLNFLAGQSVPNLVIMKLGAGGQLSIFNELGTTDVIVDVMGYVR